MTEHLDERNAADGTESGGREVSRERDEPARDPESRGGELTAGRGVVHLWRSFRHLPQGWQTTLFSTLVTSVVAVAAIVAGFFDGPDVVVQPAPLPTAEPSTGAEQPCRGTPLRGEKSGVSEVAVYMRVPGGCWSQILGYVPPGSELEYVLSYKNGSDEQHDDVVFRASLPTGMRLVSGSTMFTNASHPEGVPASSDNLESGGINLGSYSPGSNAWVSFRVTIPGASEAECGVSEYRVVGVANPWGADEQSNTSVLSAYRSC